MDAIVPTGRVRVFTYSLQLLRANEAIFCAWLSAVHRAANGEPLPYGKLVPLSMSELGLAKLASDTQAWVIEQLQLIEWPMSCISIPTACVKWIPEIERFYWTEYNGMILWADFYST